MVNLRIVALTWLCPLLLTSTVIANPVGGIGIPCGKNVSTNGMVCCNASCDICTRPGDKCLAVICPATDGGPAEKRQDIPQLGQCGPKQCGPNQRCCDPACGYCVYAFEVCLPQMCSVGSEASNMK